MPAIPATAAADDALVAPPADEGKRLWRGIAPLVLWIPTLLGTIAFLLVRRTLDEPIALRAPLP